MKKKGMKKKGKERGSEEAKKKNSKRLLSVAIVAVLVSSVLIAFMPLAAADITSFTITPDTGVAGVVSAYKAVLNTTAEFTTLNATIAAKFGLEEPTDSELIARVDLQNNTIQDYGYITFTANGSDPANKLDVFAYIGGDTANATVDVNYSAGGTTTAGSPFGGASYVKVTLPTYSADGSLELSLPMGMRYISVDIKKFMKNPTTCGDYTFDVTVNGYSASDTVRIIPSVSNPSATPDVIPDDTDNDPRWGETSMLNVTVTCDNLLSVTIDLSQIGGSSVQPMSNVEGDIWSVTTNASAGTTPGTYYLPVNATGIYGGSNTTVSISLRVQKNGDVKPYDGDGVVTFIGDALYLLRHTRNVAGYKAICDNIADVNGDGVVNFIGDALYLLRHTRNVGGYEILK